MRRCYIAGPMSPTAGGGPVEYLRNCSRMIDAARYLIKAGIAPFCPAVDLLYFIGGTDNETPTAAEIKAYSLSWLDVCDCVLLMPGWSESVGTMAEVDYAESKGLPVFKDLNSCRHWVATRPKR